MYRIAICDDNVEELAKITNVIRSYADFDLQCYSNSWKLALDIKNGAFDLYLLDIVMPKPDGVELGHLIREKDDTAAIIYLTGNEDRSLDAFRVRAAQYLIKPVSGQTLRKEIDIALSLILRKKGKFFFIKTKNGMRTVPFHKIMYCELCSRCLCCMTADGNRCSSVTLRVPFGGAIAPLLEDRRFFQPHTSFVINMDFVSGITGDALLMAAGTRVPIAKNRRKQTKDFYTGYFFAKEQK